MQAQLGINGSKKLNKLKEVFGESLEDLKDLIELSVGLFNFFLFFSLLQQDA